MKLRLWRGTLWMCSGILVVMYLAPTISAIFQAVQFVLGRSLHAVLLELGERRLVSALWRSAASSSVVATITVPVLAWGLYTFQWRSRWVQRTILGCLIMPLFLPEGTHAFAVSSALVAIGFRKGVFAVALAEIGYVTPFCALLIMIQYGLLPTHLRLTAADLGMSSGIFFRKVLFPLLAPVVLATVVFAFLLAFNEYSRTEFLQAREMYSTYLYGQLASGTKPVIYLVSTLAFFIGGIVLAGLTGVARRRAGAR